MLFLFSFICASTFSGDRNSTIASKYYRHGNYDSQNNAYDDVHSTVDDKYIVEIYQKLKTNSYKILTANMAIVNYSDKLHLEDNVINTIRHNISTLLEGIPEEFCDAFEDELFELAAVVCFCKLHLYNYLFHAFDRIFKLNKYEQDCLYNEILDYVNGINYRIAVSSYSDKSVIQKLVLYVMRVKIVKLLQSCHENYSNLSYFIKYPALVIKSIKGIMHGTNYSGREDKFVFYDLLYSYVNKTKDPELPDNKQNVRNEDAIDTFIDDVFDIYSRLAENLYVNSKKNTVIRYSFPNLNIRPDLNNEFMQVISRYNDDKELSHLLMLPLTYFKNRQKATLTKIVSKETGRKLKKIAKKQPFQKLGFFVFLHDVKHTKYPDDCMLDALGLQYNADALECGISYSMMTLPMEYPGSTLLVDYTFVITTWLSKILKNSEKHTSYYLYIPDIEDWFVVRKFKPSIRHLEMVELFFGRCRQFRTLDTRFRMFERAQNAGRKFEDFVKHILHTYFSFTEQRKIHCKYNALARRELALTTDQ